AVHAGARVDVRLVPGPYARWPQESLEPNLTAHGPRRLPPEEPGRPWRRLADHLRRTEALLRQARSSRRDLRVDGRPPQRARRRLSAGATATLLRAVDQTGGR